MNGMFLMFLFCVVCEVVIKIYNCLYVYENGLFEV